jgi:hypothetical protein
METLFALVLTVAMTNGDYQDVILGSTTAAEVQPGSYRAESVC